MPSLVEVVDYIVGVWPLIVAYLKETGPQDRLRQSSCIVYFIGLLPYLVPQRKAIFLLEERNRWISVHTSDGKDKVPIIPSDSQEL